MPRPDRRSATARWGERLAEALLRAKGYRIEARNWRCSLGEIDLVCEHRGTLVFVEVKARSSLAAGGPEDAVTPGKQARLVRLATAYLAGREGTPPPCRFDVVAVDGSGLLPSVRHIRDAFRADPPL